MTSQELSYKIRTHVLQMTHDAKCSHVGSCLSIADILAVLYGGILDFQPNNPQWDRRDRFILSKGHSCAALYAVLAECGFFPISELKSFYQNGSYLEGHANNNVPGVDVSTGSLGNGLSIGCGMAIALKQKVYVILSDGDLNEGSTWEAIMFASQYKLSNLTAIVDYNQMQALGKSKGILDLVPLNKKWKDFGWIVEEVDGHDHFDIITALMDMDLDGSHKPHCMIANTIKGKGVSSMENRVEWHYKYPDDDELKKALAELK